MTTTRRGFTLIELLVVISIISLLASISLNSLSGARMKARNMQRVRGLLEVQKALELYASNNGGLYPPSPVPGPYYITCWECTWLSSPGDFPYDGNKLAAINLYLNPRPSDPSAPTGGRFGGGTTNNYRGFLYKTNANHNAYKVVVYNTVELPQTPNPTNLKSLMLAQGIPDKLIDLNFPVLGTPVPAISISSSAEASQWNIWDGGTPQAIPPGT